MPTHLEFGDRSFDAVVCLRVLMHTPDWRQSLGELCRVADRRVVIDYPSATSAAALEAGVRRVAHLVGAGDGGVPRVLRSRRIARGRCAPTGFGIAGVHRQFVLPIALHKTHRLRALDARHRRHAGARRPARLFGSPVTIVAERCAS